MIKRELAKDPELKNENWDRFLPKFSSNLNASSEKKKKMKSIGTFGDSKKKKKKKEYTPFPPEQLQSKVDKQLESGEYFLNEQQRLERKRVKKMNEATENSQIKKQQRGIEFQAPAEPKYESNLNASSSSSSSSNSNSSSTTDAGRSDMEALKRRLMEKQTKVGSSVPSWGGSSSSNSNSKTSKSTDFVAPTEQTLKRTRENVEGEEDKKKKKRKKEKKEKKKKKKKKKDDDE